MKNNIIFADNLVGLECLLYLIEHHDNNVHKIVITNIESLVYKKLKEINYGNSKIIFYKDFKKNKYENINYIFLLWWPYIIDKEIINIPKYGVINTHPSLLPYNRGKHYNFWNLVEDVPFGVTLHFVNEKIDNGDILFQKQIIKNWEDNGKSLYEKAQIEMIELFKESYKEIVKHNYKRKKQDLNQGGFHYSKELEKASQLFLDDNYKARDLLNLLRARTFPPYNGCYFFDEGNEYEVQIQIKRIIK